MKYNQTKYKLRTIWNQNETNQNKIDLKSSESFAIKNNMINKFYYSFKKEYNYSTDWEYLLKPGDRDWYYGIWNISFNNFCLKYISCIKAIPIFRTPTDDTISVGESTKLFQIKDLSAEISDVTLIYSMSIYSIQPVQAKLLVQITNPEFYI